MAAAATVHLAAVAARAGLALATPPSAIAAAAQGTDAGCYTSDLMYSFWEFLQINK